MQTPVCPVHEHQDGWEQVERIHAQDVQGSVGGPSRASATPLSAFNAKVMAAIATFQGTVATLVAMMVERQPATQNSSMAPAPINVQPAPREPSLPTPREETWKEVKLHDFLKLKSLVFTWKDPNEFWMSVRRLVEP